MMDEKETLRASTAQHFEWSIRALAQSTDVQLSLFPDFVCKADELALDYEERWGNFREELGESLTSEQLDSISALDKHLRAMSGLQNEKFWTDESMVNDPEWRLVRELALRVVAVMGWSSEPPPPGRSIYIGPNGRA
ncbi:hypothetical protein [Chondromyces crocatus]|uniref:Uncharacterized protein n=1 Tax=Chondromyces crocatus TaxID=52 RepID=A0A0K1EBR1_CHOCO|nr:hypothetical protein [Chondromyces crocatus]AKT38326.1 uncharacterized protein CMC5_024710 [Chondromyces crocatus]